MNCKYLQSRLDYIELLFNYFNSQTLDDELKSHISKYLTVLISGTYEDIIKNVIKEYVFKENVTKEIKNFTSRQINIIFRNPTSKNLKSFLNQFNKKWFIELKEKIDGTNFEALDSIVNNKNLIAHGENTSITFDDIKNYYEQSKTILIELDNIVLYDES